MSRSIDRVVAAAEAAGLDIEVFAHLRYVA